MDTPLPPPRLMRVSNRLANLHALDLEQGRQFAELVGEVAEPDRAMGRRAVDVPLVDKAPRPHPKDPSGTIWDEGKVAELFPKLAQKYEYNG